MKKEKKKSKLLLSLDCNSNTDIVVFPKDGLNTKKCAKDIIWQVTFKFPKPEVVLEIKTLLEATLPKLEESTLEKFDLGFDIEESEVYLFERDVFSCKKTKGDSPLKCNVKKGDNIVLMFPSRHLRDFDRCKDNIDYVVAVKHNRHFSQEEAARIFVEQTTFPIDEELKKKYINTFNFAHVGSVKDFVFNNKNVFYGEYIDFVYLTVK